MADYDIIKDYIFQNCIHFSVDSPAGKMPLRDKSFIFDLRSLTMHPTFGPMVGKMIWDRIKKYNIGCIFTKGVGGASLLTNIQVAAKNEDIDLYTLIVRDSRKDTNRKTLIEGVIPPTSCKALFIDDLVNTGDTFNQCKDAFAETGINVRLVGAACVVTLSNPIGTRSWDAQGVINECLFRRENFGITRSGPPGQLSLNLIDQILTNNSTSSIDLRSPPIIHDSKIYWATDEQKVYCYNLENNEIVWSIETPVSEENQSSKGIVNLMSIDNAFIYFNTYSGTCYKLNKLTGEIIWSNKLSTWIHSSPTLSADGTKIYIGTENKDSEEISTGDIVALDKQTGFEIWRTTTNALVPCTPLEMLDRIIVGNNDNKLFCLDAVNGSMRWTLDLNGPAKGRAANVGSQCCVTTENGWFYLINTDTGEIDYQDIKGSGFRNNFTTLYNNNYITIDQQGLIQKISTTGRVDWLITVRGKLSWFPSIVGNIAYLSTDNGTCYSINLDSGVKLKVGKIRLNNKDNEETILYSPPAANSDIIAFNTNNKGLLVYAISN